MIRKKKGKDHLFHPILYLVIFIVWQHELLRNCLHQLRWPIPEGVAPFAPLPFPVLWQRPGGKKVDVHILCYRLWGLLITTSGDRSNSGSKPSLMFFVNKIVQERGGKEKEKDNIHQALLCLCEHCLCRLFEFHEGCNKQTYMFGEFNGFLRRRKLWASVFWRNTSRGKRLEEKAHRPSSETSYAERSSTISWRPGRCIRPTELRVYRRVLGKGGNLLFSCLLSVLFRIEFKGRAKKKSSNNW